MPAAIVGAAAVETREVPGTGKTATRPVIERDPMTMPMIFPGMMY